MRIQKIVRRRKWRLWVAPLLVLGFVVATAAPGAAELRDPEGKQGEEAAEPDLKEGEYIKKTPFGVTKRGPAKKTDKLAGTRDVEVEENGDLITFRRLTPFGKQIWKRKRSELSAFEKGLLDAHHAAKPTAGSPAASSGTIGKTGTAKSAEAVSAKKKSDR